MSRDPAAVRQFVQEFIVAWLISFVLGLVALGLSNALLVNAVTALGGGQFASSNETTEAFWRGVRLYAPIAALFSALYVLISLFVAMQLTARYPRRRLASYAFAGAVVPLAIGLISLSLNLIGALIGALALFAAARLIRNGRPDPLP